MIIPDKIKKEYKIKLEELCSRDFDKSLFVYEQVLADMWQITSEIKYEVAVVLDRKGHIVDVAVGDKTSVALSVEKTENRLCGYRIIHTHPSGDCSLSKMDLSFLKTSHLDCIAAVSVKDGKPYDLQVGFLLLIVTMLTMLINMA